MICTQKNKMEGFIINKDGGITVDFWVIKVHTSIKDLGINKDHTSFREPKLAHQTLSQADSSGPLNPPDPPAKPNSQGPPGSTDPQDPLDSPG